MRVLLVRHGEAVDSGVASDGERWLTDAGRAGIRRVAAALMPEDKPTHMFTSPLVRAVQTAEIIAAGVGYSGAITAWRGLAGGTTAQAAGALEHVPVDGVAIMVGHEPGIRILAAHLGGRASLSAFQTGTVCAVEIDGAWSGRPGVMQWIQDPESLARALG